MCDYVKWCDVTNSFQSQVKGVSAEDAFQEQCFLCERRASVGADFQDLVHVQEHILNSKGKEKMKKAQKVF